MKNRSIKTSIAALAIVAMAMPLAACEGKLPEPVESSATGKTVVSPDLTEAQEQKIRSAILDTLNKANSAKSADGLSARVADPQLAIRTSEITVAQKTGSLRAEATIPSGLTQTVIPTTDGWPRTVYSITTTTDDQQSKRLLVLTQASAKQNYKLTAVARLFPGASMPKFEIASIGSTQGTADDTGLVMTPKDAVNQYADVLQNGGSSKYAASFSNDYFRQQLDQLTSVVKEGMDRNNGTQEQTFSADTSQMWVMRSPDGGDLVVARINSVWTRKAGDGRESQPASDEEKALYNGGDYTSTMKVTYVNVVALYIPAKDSGQKVTAVGAERQPVKVEAV